MSILSRAVKLLLVCTPLAVSALPTGCSAGSEVRHVYMALDGQGDRKRVEFYPDTVAIYCDADYVGTKPDTTVQAQIHRYSDGNGPEAILAAGENASGTTQGVVAFTWTQPTNADGVQVGYPVGNYTCDVSVNGVSAGSAPFKVVYPDPPCPAAGVATPGQNCATYFPAGATCPHSADDYNKSCVCDGSTWQCP